MNELQVEALFSRLLVRYGAAWRAKWAGVEPDAVKADWAHELRGMPGDAIRYALENLPPDHPPTVTQFRALCNRAPVAPSPKLTAPPADPVRVKQAIDRMNAFRKEVAPDPEPHFVRTARLKAESLAKAQAYAQEHGIDLGGAA